MENKLKQALDEAKMFDEVKLEGEIRLGRPTGSSFFVGKSFSKNLININKPNITIDGEWDGQCIGLENKGDFSKINGNKILATHTIKGRSVRNYGNDCVFDGNILTSTSKNPRLFQHEGSNCIITNNLMEALIGLWDYKSSCGIYAISDNAMENIIANNIIKNICDCGIFAGKKIGLVTNNIVTTYEEWTRLITQATDEDIELLAKLDENNIQSIVEE